MKFTRTTTITKIERKILKVRAVSRTTDVAHETEDGSPHVVRPSAADNRLEDGEATPGQEK